MLSKTLSEVVKYVQELSKGTKTQASSKISAVFMVGTHCKQFHLCIKYHTREGSGTRMFSTTDGARPQQSHRAITGGEEDQAIINIISFKTIMNSFYPK